MKKEVGYLDYFISNAALKIPGPGWRLSDHHSKDLILRPAILFWFHPDMFFKDSCKMA